MASNVELIWALNPLLEAIGITIWIVFIGDFGSNFSSSETLLPGGVMTAIASDYFPKTAEGRVLCFLLALCAIAVCGYLTATLATFFVSQDAQSDRAELAGAKSLQALQTEITALRTEIQVLSQKG
ncbi:hypothetical protein NDI47_23285 [Microcoleus vaginatus GB1-A2]|uniref:hypothetical protein n=1 Tax=Microcoleus vaginatus TaxID=119532 RepID=UPI0018EFD6CE